MISSARPTSRRNTRPDALANKTSSVSPHAHGGRMTLFPWINPITREAPYSRESRSSCKHTCAVTAQTPKFRRRITGGTPGNVKLLLPPRQSRGNSQYIRPRLHRYMPRIAGLERGGDREDSDAFSAISGQATWPFQEMANHLY